MQEYVDIGRSRTARRVYGLNQIDIVPSRRTRSSHDVDTSWKIDAYSFDIPVMTHPTDSIVTPEFAIEFGQLGGLPVINAEGLWGRVDDLDAALRGVVEAARKAEAFLFEEQGSDAGKRGGGRVGEAKRTGSLKADRRGQIWEGTSRLKKGVGQGEGGSGRKGGGGAKPRRSAAHRQARPERCRL